MDFFNGPCESKFKPISMLDLSFPIPIFLKACNYFKIEQNNYLGILNDFI
jgi:hypothetical protein